METSDNRIEGGRGKFKRRSVSAVRDFPLGCGRMTTPNYCLTVPTVRDFLPGCGRVTASNYGLTRQITIDHSSEGK
ncbi:hypothetical protein J1N35_025622 [Gossypium stocksii]|uniref:Uncharacterized protein n=1 Tax=Gossypium stocksii TaxID=47602 RepID=A0A9D3ZY07_9ROSI|nr:hypothetical protein J1N35_025622 [Gossypium stocksii]